MTMKTTVNVTCDGDQCEHTRAGDSNHWLVGVKLYDTSVTLASTRSQLALHNNTGIHVIPEEVKDFCGEECAIKWVSKMLAEIKK